MIATHHYIYIFFIINCLHNSNTMLFSSSMILGFILFVGFASGEALPAQELEALKAIGRSLGQTNWSLKGDGVDPCSQKEPWFVDEKKNAVICNYTNQIQNITVSHVTHIILKGLNLNGSLPQELVGLPFLQRIDLTRNYLNGTIPPQWGSMQSLQIISLQGNRLTGQIPRELANLTALTDLVLEANEFTGNISSDFGNLPRIQRLLLTSNNLSGELPASLAKLTTLTEFRISDNNFTGSIPSYIQNWVNIKRIEIQATGLTGPIPSNLNSLTNLIDLRISDLANGSQSYFPNISTNAKWDNLILRSCNMLGKIPLFIGEMTIDESLDLSFNKLTGGVPQNIGNNKKNIYLTGNSLSGPVPDAKQTKGGMDLSYNSFDVSLQSSESNCREGKPNLFANSKGSNNTLGSFYCVSRKCHPDEYYYFRVNCGSPRKEGDYEEDGPGDSKFFESNSNWGFSSTGEFLNSDIYGGSFTSSLNNIFGAEESQLYKDARLSPLSLTYYGYCLRNGNYTVKLHFAEIMFTNTESFESLGRRMFDVYIQGTRMLADFNIETAAGGVYKPHVETFTANVSDHTLEIRFYWAGKGTNSLPERSVYGPLISAISAVHAEYKPPASGLSAGAIAGIVMAAVFGSVILVVGFLKWKGKHSMHQDLKGLDLQTGSFTLRQIRAATNNFDPANKIGEGGFGPVFKGVLLDGTIIAVKQLSSKSKQGNREFVNEIGMISALQHPHLVKLYGCCIEGNQLLLVYEYMENNSLARALFGPEEQRLHLDWATRHTICIGIARGLAYLHEESRLKIVHRDIKATNVLLDGNLVPKISDFGLAKLDEEDDTHICTRIAGTFGYMAPEYAMRGYLTDKADVYSFGVVLLEIVSGRSNSSIRPKAESFYLLDWANSLKVQGKLMELVDPRLESSPSLDKKKAMRAINIALLCTNAVAAERPSMSAVVSMLEGRDWVDNSIEVTPHQQAVEMVSSDDGEGQSVSMDAPWTTSSASASDLYPLALDTAYWDNRPL